MKLAFLLFLILYSFSVFADGGADTGGADVPGEVGTTSISKTKKMIEDMWSLFYSKELRKNLIFRASLIPNTPKDFKLIISKAMDPYLEDRVILNEKINLLYLEHDSLLKQNKGQEAIDLYVEKIDPLIKEAIVLTKLSSDLTYLKNNKFWVNEKGPCPFPGNSEGKTATVSPTNLKGEICVSAYELSRFPEEVLDRIILGYLHHELAHLMGVSSENEELAKAYEKFIFKNAEIILGIDDNFEFSSILKKETELSKLLSEAKELEGIPLAFELGKLEQRFEDIQKSIHDSEEEYIISPKGFDKLDSVKEKLEEVLSLIKKLANDLVLNIDSGFVQELERLKLLNGELFDDLYFFFYGKEREQPLKNINDHFGYWKLELDFSEDGQYEFYDEKGDPVYSYEVITEKTETLFYFSEDFKFTILVNEENSEFKQKIEGIYEVNGTQISLIAIGSSEECGEEYYSLESSNFQVTGKIEQLNESRFIISGLSDVPEDLFKLDRLDEERFKELDSLPTCPPRD